MTQDNQGMKSELPRLNSWKEIGAYLERDGRTTQRWEKEEGLPVHRHSHRARSSVYAYPSEIDAWRESRKALPEPPPPQSLWKSLLAPPRRLAFSLTMALCLVMAGNGLRPQAAEAQQKPRSARLLCDTGDCGDSHADLSPDGQWVIVTDWSGSGDLKMRNLSTNEERRLFAKKGTWADNNAYADYPVFSPDMKRVAFLWDPGNRGASPFELRTMEIVPGSEPRVLLKAPEDVFFFEPMDWSGDGQRLYSAIRAKDRTWRLASVSTTDGKVQTLKNLGWRFNSTNDDDRARLSPDGRFLVYAALPVNPPRFPLPTDMNTNRHLYLLATDGSSESELIRSSGNNLNPVWTADGLQVLFTGNRSGSPALWSIAVRKGQAAGKEALASSTVGNFGYRVSPAGTYYYNQLVQLNVSRVIAMEPGARRVAGAVASAGEIIDGLNPSWSPNGKLLAFSRANPTKGSELIVRNMENGEEKAFRNPLLIDSAALWMGDRRILKNMSNSQGGTSLFLLDVQTGQFTETIKLTATMRGGQPTHDGKTVFVIDADNKFVAMDFPSGGHRRTVYEAHIGSVIHGYRLRPQGDKFLLRIQKGTREVLAEIALDGSRYHEIFEGPAKLTGINWTPDGEGILFSQAVEGTQHRRVKTVARTGGQPADTGIELEDGGYFAVNPDGTRIVIHEREAVTELWALDNVAPPLK